MVADIKKVKDTINVLKNLEAELWTYVNDFDLLIRKHSEFKTKMSELSNLALSIDLEQKSFGTDNSLHAKLLLLEARLIGQVKGLSRIDKEVANPEELKKILKGDLNFKVDDQVYKNIPEWLSETQKRILILEQDIDKLVEIRKNAPVVGGVKVSVAGKDLVVETEPHDAATFEASLAIIKSKGYKRYLTPIEYGELLKEDKGMNLGSEWTGLLLNFTNVNHLRICLNPESVKWRGQAGYEISRGVIYTIPLGNLKTEDNNPKSSFPKELINIIGPHWELLHLHRAKYQTDTWLPVRVNGKFGLTACTHSDLEPFRGVK